jgi:hypothetical protein
VALAHEHVMAEADEPVVGLDRVVERDRVRGELLAQLGHRHVWLRLLAVEQTSAVRREPASGSQTRPG